MSIRVLSLVTLVVFSSLSSAVYADQFLPFDNAGVYVGLQGGYGEVDYGTNFKNFFHGSSGSIDEDGIAGRGYLGIQFNPYLGLEAGYARFSDNKYRIHATDRNGNPFNIDTKFETQQLDALFKIGMPFGCSGFRGDIKAGAAYIMTDAHTSANISSYQWQLVKKVSNSEDTFVPAAGASLSYNFNKNIAMDVSYLHGFGKGKVDSPSTDLVSLGISYLFA